MFHLKKPSLDFTSLGRLKVRSAPDVSSLSRLVHQLSHSSRLNVSSSRPAHQEIMAGLLTLMYSRMRCVVDDRRSVMKHELSFRRSQLSGRPVDGLSIPLFPLGHGHQLMMNGERNGIEKENVEKDSFPRSLESSSAPRELIAR